MWQLAKSFGCTRLVLARLEVELGGVATPIFTRLLAWDASPLPECLRDDVPPAFRLRIDELPVDASSIGPLQAIVPNAVESRHYHSDPHGSDPSASRAEDWGLMLPCRTVEVWCLDSQHVAMQTVWETVPEGQRRQLFLRGFLPNQAAGFLGSLVAHVPVRAPFPGKNDRLIVPQGSAVPVVVSEMWDGPLMLNRSLGEPDLVAGQVDVVEVPDTFAGRHAQNGAVVAKVRLSGEGIPVGSQSDYRLRTVLEGGSIGPSSSVGTIRTIGFSVAVNGRSGQPFKSKATSEPWRHRVGSHGFAPPVELLVVGKQDFAARDEALRLMADADGDLRILDAYLDAHDALDTLMASGRAGSGRKTGRLRCIVGRCHQKIVQPRHRAPQRFLVACRD